MQSGYQIAALMLTIGLALVGGTITGFIMKIPLMEQHDIMEEMFDDEPHWFTPDDYTSKVSEVSEVQVTQIKDKDENTSTS